MLNNQHWQNEKSISRNVSKVIKYQNWYLLWQIIMRSMCPPMKNWIDSIDLERTLPVCLKSCNLKCKYRVVKYKELSVGIESEIGGHGGNQESNSDSNRASEILCRDGRASGKDDHLSSTPDCSEWKEGRVSVPNLKPYASHSVWQSELRSFSKLNSTIHKFAKSKGVLKTC